MLSHSRRALEEFDNQHDFERMAADLLNGLGYSAVAPVSPAGGADSGKDITFSDGGVAGVAFVTLNKDIRAKFSADLSKLPRSAGEGIIALFCNVSVTASSKAQLAKEAMSHGYRLEIYDLERLRSLLDTSQKEIRRRYLHIDDEVADRLRSEVAKLIRFPNAVPDEGNPPTILETLETDALPRRLFDLLLKYKEADIKELPGIGSVLHGQFLAYYDFRTNAIAMENEILLKIGGMVGVRFPMAWQIYFKYCLMRFAGASSQTIQSRGEFLNYGITWDAAETLFSKLAGDSPTAKLVVDVIAQYDGLSKRLAEMKLDA